MKVHKTLKKTRDLLHFFPKKGYKMKKLHFYTGAGPMVNSGIKACVFGSTAAISSNICNLLLMSGTPMVMCHRSPMDVFSPMGDDAVYHQSNPYKEMKEFILNWDTYKTVSINYLS
jgi:hypothetical protein